jgi:two-component system, LuxR family, response regulator FixJ
MVDIPTVFVVDDDDSVRHAVAALLSSVGMVVKEYETAELFLDSYSPGDSGCLVLDVRMPKMSGLDLQKEIIAKGMEIPIVFITGHGDVPMSVRAMKHGAVDYLLKPFNDQQLLDAVQDALTAESELRKAAGIRTEAQDRVSSLTRREREVLALVIEGRTNKEVGNALGIAEATIKIHRSRVMQKMQADSLPDLVRLAQAAEFWGVDE